MQSYTITTFGSGTDVSVINSSGQIAGFVSYGQAGLYTNGAFVGIAPPGSASSVPIYINAAGQVAAFLIEIGISQSTFQQNERRR
jgi:hypothetical protein